MPGEVSILYQLFILLLTPLHYITYFTLINFTLYFTIPSLTEYRESECPLSFITFLHDEDCIPSLQFIAGNSGCFQFTSPTGASITELLLCGTSFIQRSLQCKQNTSKIVLANTGLEEAKTMNHPDHIYDMSTKYTQSNFSPLCKLKSNLN